MIVDFEKWHLTQMQVRQQELTDCGGLEGLQELTQVSICYTLLIDNKPIAVFGFCALWKGVIDVFVIPSVDVPKHPIAFIKAAKQKLSEYTPVVRRMQTKSRADCSTDRWMQAMGFTCEGTMVGYTEAGADYRIWARVNRGSD